MNKAKKQAGVTYRRIGRNCKRRLLIEVSPYSRLLSAKATREILGKRRRNRIKAERLVILADSPACFEMFSREWDCRPHPVKANERIQDDFCCRCRFIKRGGQH